MANVTDEALAGIRLMVCMAKADGKLKSDERFALEEALAGLALPGGLTVDQLLAEKNDPKSLAEIIENAQSRDSTYASVFALAYCDRELAPEEESLLALLRNAWGIHKDEDHALITALEAGAVHEHITKTVHVIPASEAEREAAFHRITTRYSILTAITGAIPVPVIPDLMVIPMQVKMVYDIARLFGQKTDKATVQLMFETLGVGTGARIGISALTKLVPGWGSVVGAASSFATTFALAKVAYAFFKSEGRTPIAEFKPLYREARQSGRQEFEKHKHSLNEAHKHHAADLKQLAFDLQQGKITQKEYEQRIDALGNAKD